MYHHHALHFQDMLAAHVPMAASYLVNVSAWREPMSVILT